MLDIPKPVNFLVKKTVNAGSKKYDQEIPQTAGKTVAVRGIVRHEQAYV